MANRRALRRSTMAYVLWLFYIYMSDSDKQILLLYLQSFFTGTHILRFYYVMGLSQGL